MQRLEGREVPPVATLEGRIAAKLREELARYREASETTWAGAAPAAETFWEDPLIVEKVARIAAQEARDWF